MTERVKAWSSEAMRIGLVYAQPLVETAVRLACPAPHTVHTCARHEVMTAQHTLSPVGRALVAPETGSDMVLFEWDMEQAPVVNALGFALRQVGRAPLVVLTRDGADAWPAALAAGADAALSVPFSASRLQGHVLAYRRLVWAIRHADEGQDTEGHDIAIFGDLRLDRTAHRFFVRDNEVELTPRELALLDFLLRRAGTLCTRDDILDQVWGLRFETGTNMVDVYMYFLRKKLEAYQLKDMIQTVRGRGYRLALPADT